MKQRGIDSLLGGYVRSASGLAGLVLLGLTLSAGAAIYNVDVSGLTLYTDPIDSAKQIKLGGFSGLYPVPGDKTHTMFYTVTDRGPTQDMLVQTPAKTTTHTKCCRAMRWRRPL